MVTMTSVMEIRFLPFLVPISIKKGGSNCCNCEKCWRTISGIYVEGFNPHKFGFEYSDKQLGNLARTIRYSGNKIFVL